MNRSQYYIMQKKHEDYLMHHGVDGQKWGVKHGPPYPLDSSKSTGSRLKTKKKLDFKKSSKDFEKRFKKEKEKLIEERAKKEKDSKYKISENGLVDTSKKLIDAHKDLEKFKKYKPEADNSMREYMSVTYGDNVDHGKNKLWTDKHGQKWKWNDVLYVYFDRDGNIRNANVERNLWDPENGAYVDSITMKRYEGGGI